MDEETWLAAMAANPHCLATMAGFADWLQEMGDPRWEGLAVLVDGGKVGGWLGYYRGYSLGHADHSRICPGWYNASGIDDLDDNYAEVVPNRMALLAAWAAASEGTRDEWRRAEAANAWANRPLEPTAPEIA